MRGAAIEEEQDALYDLGSRLEQQGRLAEAGGAYRDAVDSGDVGAFHGLGNVAGSAGDFEEAARNWLRGAEAGVPESMYALADHFIRQGCIGQACLWHLQAVADTAALPDQDPLRAALEDVRRRLATAPVEVPNDPAATARDLWKIGKARYLESLFTRDAHAQAHAVIALRLAMGLVPDSDALKPGLRCDLLMALLSHALEDLDRRKFDAAAREARASLQATPSETMSHLMRQASLGLVLMSRFEFSYGETAELDEAESALRSALAAWPSSDMRRVMLEGHLARAAKLRRDVRDLGWSSKDGQPASGGGSIRVLRRPQGGHRWVIDPGGNVVGYCRLLLEDYRRRNDPDVLRQALEITETVIAKTYPADDRRRYPVLVAHGMLLLAEHERTEDGDRLAQALGAAREVRKYFSSSDLTQLGLLEDWAGSLCAAHVRAAEPTLLSEAALVLDQVSSLYVTRHHLSRECRPDSGHLNRAVQAARAALALSVAEPDGYRDLAFRLGLVLMMRHMEHGGPCSELEEAEWHFRSALNGLPAGDQRRADIDRCISAARQMRS